MKHLIVLALALSTTVAAADAPSKELGYFVGTWKCQESWMKSDLGPAYESTATLVAKDDTDGVWLAWSYVQDASPKNKQPPKGNDLWGYDPSTKTFVRDKYDNYAPGARTHLTSKGFVGDTISWDGPVRTPKGEVPFKHTFKKLDGKTIEGKLFMGGQQFYSGKCTRQ